MQGIFKKEDIGFDIRNLITLSIEIMINVAFDNSNKVDVKFDQSFPTDVTGDMGKLKNAMISLNYALFKHAKNTTVDIYCHFDEALTSNRCMLSFEYSFISADHDINIFLTMLTNGATEQQFFKLGIDECISSILFHQLGAAIEHNIDTITYKIQLKIK